MDDEKSFDEALEVSCQEAKAELERLLADPRFHGTERTRSILRYLADRRIEGQDDSVKAYAIALDVLGRPSGFDATTDPIVRIEMSRLRSSLAQYYEAFGSENVISIHLPKGRYVAVFTRTDGSPRVDEASMDGGRDEAALPSASLGALDTSVDEPSGRRWRLSALAVSAAAVVGLVAACWYAAVPAFTDKPIVNVSMLSADDQLKGEASLARDMLLTALTQFQTLTVASRPIEGQSFATVIRPPRANAYNIELKYYGDGSDRNIWWQVVDARSGNLLKSGLERISADGKAALGVREEIVTVLSRRFAAARGVINSIEVSDSADNALGNACVLRAERDLDESRLSDLATVSGCLQQTIAREPGNSDATAALARVVLAQSGGSPSEALSQRALELADRAASLAPLSDRAQIASMKVQFYIGRTQAAISAGNRALALNPNNPDVSAKLGFVLFTSGFWDAGVSLAHDAANRVDAAPDEVALVLALDAYRREDWSSASLLAEQISGAGLVVNMLRAASLAELGSNQATERLAEVRSLRPDFETRYAELMSARRLDASLADSIGAGLVKAGARIAPRNLAASF